MIFNQPFPRDPGFKKQFFTAAIAGIIVTLFLYVFRPFGFEQAPVPDLFFFAIGYGLITFFVVASFGFLELMSPKLFAEERWTIGKNLLLYIAIVFVIGCLNFIYTVMATGMPLSFKAFLSFQLFTLSVTFVVVSGLTMIKYFRSLKFYSESAKQVEEEVEELKKSKDENPFVTIVSENEKENMTMQLSELFYIESADNYSRVVYRNEEKIISTLIRSSLKKLEDRFTQPELFRCHRSYIVQLKNVEKVTGNSQGYHLHFKDIQESVPVSRKLNEEIHERLKKLSKTVRA